MSMYINMPYSAFFHIKFAELLILNSGCRKGCIIRSLLEHPVVGLVATLHKVSPAQVLLRFFVQQGVIVIPKSVHIDRIAANFNVSLQMCVLG